MRLGRASPWRVASATVDRGAAGGDGGHVTAVPVEAEERHAHGDLGRRHLTLGEGEHPVEPGPGGLRARLAPRSAVGVGHDLQLVGGRAEPGVVLRLLRPPRARLRALRIERQREEAVVAVQSGGQLLDEGREGRAIGHRELLPVEVDAVVPLVEHKPHERVYVAPARLWSRHDGRRQLVAERRGGCRTVGDGGEQVGLAISGLGDQSEVLVHGEHTAVGLREVPVEVDLVERLGGEGGGKRAGVAQRPGGDAVGAAALGFPQVAERRLAGALQMRAEGADGEEEHEEKDECGAAEEDQQERVASALKGAPAVIIGLAYPSV